MLFNGMVVLLDDLSGLSSLYDSVIFSLLTYTCPVFTVQKGCTWGNGRQLANWDKTSWIVYLNFC